MTSSISGKIAIVTGAGRGIGRAIAMGFAEAGAKVVVADIMPDTAEATAKDVETSGGTALNLVVDVANRESVQEMIAATVKEFGRLDVMVNNAGIAQAKLFANITDEEWQRVMDVNAKSVLIGTQEAVKQFKSQGGGGKIINTASIAGKQGFAPLAHYCASKFAVVALTQAGAQAFGADKININCICPGIVATEMWNVIGSGFKEEGLTENVGDAFENFSQNIPLGRPSESDDLVGVCNFLASSASDYMTGQSLVVDGGIVFA